MYILLFVPFFIQMALISIDEWFFHIPRGLPKWERIGHPLDTLTVLACFLFVLCVPYAKEKMMIYICLSLFSCLFITKDEFVHKHHCPASEQWLHALLFLNHPVLLTLCGLLWPVIHQASSIHLLDPLLSHTNEIRLFFVCQAIAVSCFLLYQLIYWNMIWKDPKKL